jgi:hypothetical protein
MTDNQRSWTLRALLLAVVLGVTAWVASCTEWTEVEVPVPPRGEAARNRYYATQQLVRQVGATVATPDNLAQFPPPNATLLLTSWHWDIFPERTQRLRQWVEGGGHLVLFTDNLNQEQLKGWLPITLQEPPRRKKPKPKEEDEPADDKDDEDDEPQAQPSPPSPSPLARRFQMPCHDTTEPETVAPHYPGPARHYKLCGITPSGWKLRSLTPALWSIDGREGPLLLRAAKGRGTVTVIQPWGMLDNDRVLKSDNGLAVVAALQARPGATVWFVAEEARPSLLVWLWREAGVALVLGAAALVLALWRGARRFGPLAAGVVSGRRSMVEQIAGTAQYLRKHGPEALLAAQIRALEAAARNHIRHYDKLDRSQRAAAIAKHTAQDAQALASALDKSLARKRTDLPATLELLETARRLLVQKRPTAPDASPRSSPRPEKD